jgi:flagellar M-ring protein FliF
LEQLRRILATIQKQLGTLSVSSKLLIASLCVIVVMGLFLVSQYAGAPAMVDLAPTGTPDDQGRIAAHLDKANIPYGMVNNRVQVSPDRRYVALASLAKAQQLPGDARLMFSNLVGQQSWLMSNSQLTTMNSIALANELSAIMRNFPGIENASVVISNPEPKGIGSSYRRPAAHVTVFPKAGTGLDQGTVNALADMVASSTAGMEARDVAVIDGTNRRSFRAASGEDMFASSYVEQVAKVEQRLERKIADTLRFVSMGGAGDVIVSVNAIVDGSRRTSKERRVLPRNDGTQVVPVEENTTSSVNSQGGKSRGAEPGIASNVGMDIATAGGSGTSSNSTDETGMTRSEVNWGVKETTQADPTGRPTKINAIVTVPREYVVEVVKRRKSGGGGGGAGDAESPGDSAAANEPTDDELRQAWDGGAADASGANAAGASGSGGSGGGLRAEIEAMVLPLLQTESASTTGTQIVEGTVRAFMTSVAMVGGGAGAAGASGGGGGGASGGGGGFMSTLSSLGGAGGIGGLIRTVMLGLLAVVSLGLMLMMVKKASNGTKLPTAEEIVGLPTQLASGDDVVGEADEGETPMTAIEVDPNELKTTKMLEEISSLVKTNPASAAGVFNRWMNPDG